MIRRPPRPALFAYPTLFRSPVDELVVEGRHACDPTGDEDRPRRARPRGPRRPRAPRRAGGDRKSTRLNSSHANISYAGFCLKRISSVGALNLLDSDVSRLGT